jgi:hypothetical protein
MEEQLRVPLEKFMDWQQCAAVMLLCLRLHNSGALPPVHELFKRPSCVDLIALPGSVGLERSKTEFRVSCPNFLLIIQFL